MKRAGWMVIVAAVLVWWGIRCVRHGNDFQYHYEAARLAAAGIDCYEPPAEGRFAGVYLMHYPPLWPHLIRPMTWLPMDAAAAVWFVVKIVLTAYTVRMMWRWLSPHQEIPKVFVGLVLVGTGRFMIDDFQLGQLTLVVIELAMIGCYLMITGRERWGAMWMGLGISLKLIPGIFLVYFVMKKAYRLAGLTVLSVVVWTGFPWLWSGDFYAQMFQRFVDQQLIGTAHLGAISGADNQSLQGMAVRLLGHFPTEMTVLPYANIMNLPLRTIKWIVYAGDVAAVGWLWWVVRRYRGWTSSMAVTCGVMLIISPNSGKSYLVALLLPVAYVVHYLVTAEKGEEWRQVRRWFVASLLFSTATADAWITRAGTDVASSVSALFWGILVMLGAVHFTVRANHDLMPDWRRDQVP